MELEHQEKPPDRRSNRVVETVVVVGLLAVGSATVGLDRDRFTEWLGFLAAGAIAVIILWIAYTLLRETTSRNAMSRRSQDLVDFERALARQQREQRAADVAKLEAKATETFDETLSMCRQLLPEFVALARLGLDATARSYGMRARMKGDVTKESLAERFKAVNELQWQHLKSDIGYVPSSEIEARLLKAREFQSLFEPARMSVGFAGEALTPAMARGREAAQLFSAIRIESLSGFRHESQEALAPLLAYFDEHLRDWLGNAVFRLVILLRERASSGASLDDEPTARARIVRLRNVLETVARFGDRLGAPKERQGDQKSVIAQIAYACFVLGVIGQLPQWFPEMGMTDDDALGGGSAGGLNIEPVLSGA